MFFDGFDAAVFLRDYWQQRPLLIKNPWKSWQNPLAPDELAGLACEDGIESRLITHAGITGSDIDRDKWAVEHGPLPETRFGKLGQEPWTLLVQSVDHFVPEVADLIDPFRFIPNWRIDDVMVSYATDGGGVGPHFDHYDVFLIQGLGQRRWQVGGHCDDSTHLLPHDDLRLLANFTVDEEWVLDPGDILYVPPGIAHNGIAVGADCMTYSVGFRAPARSEIISHWCDHLLAEMHDDDRFTDLPAQRPQDNPGEISPAAIARLHAMVTAKLADRDDFARWFGTYTTARKHTALDWEPEEQLEAEDMRALLSASTPLLRNPASRFCFIHQDACHVLLMVDGESFECVDEAAELARNLCAHTRLATGPALGQSAATVAVLLMLHGQGSIAFDTDE